MRTTRDLATLRAFADEALRRHLPLAAHPLDFGGTLGGGMAPRDAYEELVRAGLRSIEHVLAFPPLNLPAREGAPADLVLLDADPVQDIRSTARIRGVMAAGRRLDRAALDRAALDRLLAGVARGVAARCSDLPLK